LNSSVATLRRSPALLELAHSLAELGAGDGTAAVPPHASRSLRRSTSRPAVALDRWRFACARSSKPPVRARDASGGRVWKR
jgi:hypothetical protein